MIRLLVPCLCVLATHSSIVAQDKKDSKGGIEILYSPFAKPPNVLDRGGLCSDAPSKSVYFRTDKTIRALLGPDVQRIKIKYYSKKFESFEKTKEHLVLLLDSTSHDKTIYRYQPWAEAVTPCIIATIEYKKGTGELEVGGVGHFCYQDAQGVHWWTRSGISALPFKK